MPRRKPYPGEECTSPTKQGFPCSYDSHLIRSKHDPTSPDPSVSAMHRIRRPSRCHHLSMSDDRVHYARNGDVRLAYRVFGESGPTVIWVPGWVVGNVDTVDDPGSPYAHGIERFSQEIQSVMWDRRGTGLSDPATHPLSLDERL